jgi:small subunit ribosomal protein S5
VTVASASSLEKDLKSALKTGATKPRPPPSASSSPSAPCKAGVHRGLRPRRLSLSRARQGARRRRPRGRPELLTDTGGSHRRKDRTWLGNVERERNREERDSEFTDKLVHINRVSKTVKGGKRFGFAALVVVGDQKGRVGFGHGKAREVPEAIRKATEAAKRGFIRVALREGRTLHHDVVGRHGAARSTCAPRPAGTGIIAGGPMRAVFETLGMADVVAKSMGSSNPYNMVRATFDALKNQDSPRSVAARRGLKVSVLQARRQRGRRGRRVRIDPWPTRPSPSSRSAPDPPREVAARDPRRAEAQQAAPPFDAGGHPECARHDREGAPPHASSKVVEDLDETHRHQGQRRRDASFMRVGRGIGSGKGKTAGRGVKGQKARSGVADQGLRGRPDAAAPAPAEARLQQHLPLSFVEVTLGRIQRAIDSGKLKAGKIDEAAWSPRRDPPLARRHPPRPPAN